jgi:hypothetical protein
VLNARFLFGVKVAMLPLQAMLPAISGDLTGLSRKVFLLIVSHFIGRLKFTVTLLCTSTSGAPLAGFVDSTTGRGLFDASAAADDPAKHRSIASAVIETRVTRFLRTIVPSDLPSANPSSAPCARSVPGR